jgi:REP element-mobilizing transposase RayT
MMLSDIGECADFCWQDIPTHFPHVQTLSRVIMPNHIHGILAINPVGESEQTGTDDTTNNRFGPQSQNLASVVRGFKIGVTKYARQHNLPFKWQPRYHEHIIRNMDELYFITDYIENNVANWEKDKFYG